MSFSVLPTEIAQDILSYLPVRSLHAFSLTSRTGYGLARGSLRTLHLGIFHTRINGLISLMSPPLRGSSTHSVPITLDTKDAKTRQQIVRNQNAKAADILQKQGQCLRDLELLMWELEKPLADALSGLRNLRRLSLRFDHSFVRHPSLGRDYWDCASAGSVWDLLSTDCGGEKVFGRLESLNLERSGITDYQLEQVIERNPRITELRLQKCLALTPDFFEYLTRSPIASTLKALHVTRNGSMELDDRILPYIAQLPALEVCISDDWNGANPHASETDLAVFFSLSPLMTAGTSIRSWSSR